ncbi:glycosyl transferase family A [Alkalihalophilus pseudofirmus]|nr:glycosyl transferase family A [Alkalihalophilus pseudofirmus]
MKQSALWSLLRRMKKLVKVTVQYMSFKKHWRQLFDHSIDQKKAKKRLKKIKYNLNELGFTKKATAELEEIIRKTNNPQLKQMAAWELALWNANQYTHTGAKKCLELIPIAAKGKKDADFLRRKAIIEAECYELLGEIEGAKQSLAPILKGQPHPDVYLAAANLESTPLMRMKWINQALELYGIAKVSLDNAKSDIAYDCLTVEETPQCSTEVGEESPKVSVIIPAYNAEEGLKTSIQSMLDQTWSNLEVLVVDDCSTDRTVEVIEEYVKADSRVRLIRAETNSGAYVARNLALQVATGEYVTINDADDWSHPEKLETQVSHLIENSSVIANTSQQARATEDLKFYRRGKPGSYLFSNMSSLLFRRELVLKEIGYWDCVRFGADGEFKRRLKKVFGEKAVVDLETGPYSFQRQSSSSLTGNSAFGFHGYFMGARKEYFDSYNYHHKVADTLRYDFPQQPRTFPVPEPMWPNREEKPSGRRHFDVIIASEFRLLGGTNMSNIEEIKAQKRMGLRTGLIQMSRYDFHSEKETNPKVRELIDGDQVQMLVYGEKVSCDVLIIRHPPILQEWQQYIPEVEAENIKVIINQPPRREYSQKGGILYEIKRCVQHMHDYFGAAGTWYTIGPQVRETLYKYHEEELKSIKLASEDWVNIIDVNEWKRSERPTRGSKIKVGRHSRSQYVKWPANRDDLLAIYPDSDAYEIHVLGGAEAPKKVLGYLPANWHVLEFGEVHPKQFLEGLDVFVYYTHPDWVEAFGRVIFEAMAVGVPVIIPPNYEELFGEAAIYAEIDEVQPKIDELMSNDEAYQAQVEKAHEYVELHFGYTKHASRLEEHVLDEQHFQ